MPAPSCRRRKTIAREMHEDGAAATAHAWHVIIAEHDDEIVEMVLARETIARIARRQFDEPIIVGVTRILGPTVVTSNCAQWQQTARTNSSIRPIKHLPHAKAPKRGRAVAFAF